MKLGHFLQFDHKKAKQSIHTRKEKHGYLRLNDSYQVVLSLCGCAAPTIIIPHFCIQPIDCGRSYRDIIEPICQIQAILIEPRNIQQRLSIIFNDTAVKENSSSLMFYFECVTLNTTVFIFCSLTSSLKSELENTSLHIGRDSLKYYSWAQILGYFNGIYEFSAILYYILEKKQLFYSTFFDT